MDIHATRADLPVLLLDNLDNGRTSEEILESHMAAQDLYVALRNEGHSVMDFFLNDSEVVLPLHCYHPEDYLVFNCREELPGITRSSALVEQTLETHGFIFTGANSRVLAFSNVAEADRKDKKG